MLRCAIGVLCAIALQGCAAQSRLHRVAVDYNDLVARTTNEVTLTNILRARDRMPLHFTSISALRGNMQMQAGAELSSVAQGGRLTTNLFAGSLAAAPTTNVGNIAEGVETFTPKISGSVTTNPNFDLTIFDTQEFYQGMISSVAPTTIAHYLNQNWPSDLITHLFVSSFVITAKGAQVVYKGLEYKDGEVIHRIINDPNDRDEGAEFAAFVKCVRLRAVRTPQRRLELFPPSAVIAYNDVSLLDGQRFDVARDKDGNPEQPVRLVKVIPGGDGLGLQKVCDIPLSGGDGTTKLFQSKQRAAFFQLSSDAMDASGIVDGKISIGGRPVEVNVNSVIRSAEGIIYYLGEYLRAPIAMIPISEPDTLPDCPREDQIIKVVSAKPRRPLVSARHNGETYYIPSREDCNGRSTQVLSLVQQLVNLQKKSAEKVGTQSIRLVN